ncbi:DUF4870 domain-containing protein [Paenibacillus campinasensis]|uniref:DUF4870 domain-containing protein n=1 Tax=Paenibacillus campinasensis TaxID=66347 RepID=A0A268ELJ0_9BACL|nr:DUF4870 domain-containing protein [Paenibacillus campinasensis]PAD73986.1 hypothetical protein CHH67_19340 [Paenibacillus campinasensis]
MKQLLSSLSYFSIFFAPFIFPFLVWVLSDNAYIARHARHALLSHLIPVIAAIPLIYLMFNAEVLGSVIMYLILFGLIYFLTFVYNVLKGVQVLREYV